MRCLLLLFLAFFLVSFQATRVSNDRSNTIQAKIELIKSIVSPTEKDSLIQSLLYTASTRYNEQQIKILFEEAGIYYEQTQNKRGLLRVQISNFEWQIANGKKANYTKILEDLYKNANSQKYYIEAIKILLLHHDAVQRFNLLKHSRYLLKALSELDKLDFENTYYCDVFYKIGNACKNNNNLTKAIEYYQKTKDCSADYKYFSLSYCEASMEIASIYNGVFDTEAAINHYKDALNHQLIYFPKNIDVALKIRVGLAQTILNEGIYDSAADLYSLNIAQAQSLNATRVEFNAQVGFAFANLLQGEMTVANKALKKAQILSQDYDLNANETILLEIALAAREALLDGNEKASKKIDLLIFDTRVRNNPLLKHTLLSLQHTLAFNKGSKLAALSTYKRADNYKDSLQLEFYKTFKDSAVIRYEKGKLDQAVFDANKTANVNALKIREKDKEQFYFMIILALLAIICFIIWVYYQKASKGKKQIENLQKELHHRVKNNLAIIDTFIEVTKEEFPGQAYETKLSELQNRINSINSVHEQLYNNQDVTALSVKAYLSTLTKNISSSYNKPGITIHQSVPESLSLQADKSFPIGLIVNEFVTNSYKYGFKNSLQGMVTIFMTENEQDYELTLKDNGIGLPKVFNLNDLDSFGMRIMQLLSKQLDGTFNLTSVNGVQLTVKFPK